MGSPILAVELSDAMVTAFSAVAVATITGIIAWVTARRRTAAEVLQLEANAEKATADGELADAQAVKFLTEAGQIFINELRQERDADRARFRKEIEALEAKIREATNEAEGLRSELHAARREIDEIVRIARAHGFEPDAWRT